MSDTAAAAVTEAPAPAAAAAEVVAPAPVSGAAKARDLAGKFLKGNAQPDPVVDAPAANDTKLPKAANDGAAKKPDAKTEDAEAKRLADEKTAAEAEKAKLDKAFKEHRRRAKQNKAWLSEKAQLTQTHAERERERIADEKLKDEDPPAWLEKHQFDFRKVAEAAIAKENETPEQRAAKEAKRSEQERLDKIEKRQADIDEREKQVRHREAVAELSREVETAWNATKASYPEMARGYSFDEIRETANALRVDFWNTHKREVPLDDVFAFMEKNAAKEAARWKREETLADNTERATVTEAKAEGETRAMGRPTVTNRDSSTRASPQAALTAEERRARAIAKTRETWRGDT